MHEGGIRGVRFNFVKHLGGRPDLAFFRNTTEKVRSLGWHLILHVDSNDLVELKDLFMKLPVPMVIDHMGRVKAGDETAPDRILWGTDWPHPNVGKHMPNDGDLVDLFAQMAPEPALQHKILVDNPARLYGF